MGREVVRSWPANIFIASLFLLYGLAACLLSLLPGAVLSGAAYDTPGWVLKLLIVPPAVVAVTVCVLVVGSLRLAVVASSDGLLVKRFCRRSVYLGWEEVEAVERLPGEAVGKFYLPPSVLVTGPGFTPIQGPCAFRNAGRLVQRIVAWSPPGHVVRRELHPWVRDLQPGQPPPVLASMPPEGPWSRRRNSSMNLVVALALELILAVLAVPFVVVLVGLNVVDGAGLALLVVALVSAAVLLFVRCLRRVVWLSPQGVVDRGILTTAKTRWDQVARVADEAAGVGSIPVLDLLDGSTRRLGALATFDRGGSPVTQEMTALHGAVMASLGPIPPVGAETPRSTLRSRDRLAPPHR